ncbi:Hypothetical predicted protein, partial [Olea europaea subsp. europaea]
TALTNEFFKPATITYNTTKSPNPQQSPKKAKTPVEYSGTASDVAAWEYCSSEVLRIATVTGSVQLLSHIENGEEMRGKGEREREREKRWWCWRHVAVTTVGIVCFSPCIDAREAVGNEKGKERFGGLN